MHKKVLDKGKPDDIMPGFKNKKVNFCEIIVESSLQNTGIPLFPPPPPPQKKKPRAIFFTSFSIIMR